MIMDKTLLLSAGQAVTASARSANIIDLGPVGAPRGASAPLARDIGKGEQKPLLIQVVEDFAACDSLTVSLQVDGDPAFGSPKTLATTGAIPRASLVAGYVFSLDAAPRGADERYLSLYYTVGGANATAGKITAGVVSAHQTN